MTLAAPVASWRLSVSAGLFLAAGPFLSGCMSEASGVSAFGFTPSVPPAAIADAIPDAAIPAAPSAAGPAADLASAAGNKEASPAEPAQAAAAATESQRPSDIVASGSTALASYAGATTPVAPAGGREADRSLFASLFATSKARTPIANAERGKSRRVVLQSDGSGGKNPIESLPGVDPSSLFEIGQRASADDEDLLEDVGESYQVASLGGMARLAPSGLMVQRLDVETGCFEPALVGLLRSVERRFGKRVVVTSGYRSPSHNARVNGAKRSQHMACKAADIIVPGVSNIAIAQYVRSLSVRGGVGTYCHTTSVHVDVGRRRDWNWTCRRG